MNNQEHNKIKQLKTHLEKGQNPAKKLQLPTWTFQEMVAGSQVIFARWSQHAQECDWVLVAVVVSGPVVPLTDAQNSWGLFIRCAILIV